MKNNIKIRKIRFFNWYRSLDAIIGYSMYTSEEVRISRRFSCLVLSTDQKDKVVHERSQEVKVIYYGPSFTWVSRGGPH